MWADARPLTRPLVRPLTGRPELGVHDTPWTPRSASRAARRPHAERNGAPGHLVQFYEIEGFLCEAVAEFLARGLEAGQPAVLIATEPHRQAVARHLAAMGVDLRAAEATGYWRAVDAAELLATFLIGREPDRARFFATVGSLIEASSRAASAAGGATAVRAYGEMVDLLWAERNASGAVRLEELWNELGERQRVTLLCAYAMGNFVQESDASALADICRLHTHVIPTERFMQADDDGRLREIALLQQRAAALAAEIARREVLEQRLAEALVEAERARAESDAASRAKSDFLAVMSHELRTPLNAIGGYVQLLELGVHGDLTAAQRGALERVQRSQRHLLSLINQVLNLARIEQGQLEYVLESVPVYSLVVESCSVIEPLFIAKHLAYEVVGGRDSRGTELNAHADREKAQQILMNLLSNAVKFTPDGGRITIDLRAVAGAGNMVAIRVQDTGPGIPAADLEAIFAPFVQLPPARAARYEGTGLGLAISRDLARAMGGDLTGSSAAGEGATFTLTLPLA